MTAAFAEKSVHERERSKARAGNEEEPMPYQCSYPGCFIATSSHYCRDHRRHCSECGLECSDVDLVAGKCRECHRVDSAGYDGCDCAGCGDGIRSGVTYAPAMVQS